MKRARTFWKALTTAGQAWWWRAIAFIPFLFAILKFTHTSRSLPWVVQGIILVLGIVWLLGTAAVSALISVLYCRARAQERAGGTGFNERWDRVISAAAKPAPPRLPRRRRSQVSGRRV